MLLRHPVDRARSAYSFARSNPAMPDHAIARETSFAGYVAWSLATRGEGAILRNHQVQHLSSAAYRADNADRWQATGSDLEEAQNLIAALPAFGIVRRFADSCRMLNACYRPYAPALTLKDWAENVSRDNTMSEDGALASIRLELGANTHAALCEANTLDLQFYEFSKSLFEQNLQRCEKPATIATTELRLLFGRLKQRLAEPRLYGRGTVKGLGSSLHPTEPAYVRLPTWEE